MTNYNDGKWHGWNGGECPVHPNTKVEVVYLEPVCVVRIAKVRSDTASNFSWKDEDAPIVAFRVIREYEEPRGGWVVVSPYGGGMDIFKTREEAVKLREDVYLGEVAAIYYAQEVGDEVLQYRG